MWGGLHGHFCFDGQESPVSVHMDLLNGHPDHEHGDEAHIDTDAELVESILFKLTKVDLPLLITALIYALLLIVSTPSFIRTVSQPFANKHFLLRPPLRAPPPFSS
ncbi:hypothetical protein CBR65_20595 [Cellvibrio sp. PSBB006]|nr:hypothetical protein CBR65_20595 [Cellvibrio sp. PSBB006]